MLASVRWRCVAVQLPLCGNAGALSTQRESASEFLELALSAYTIISSTFERSREPAMPRPQALRELCTLPGKAYQRFGSDYSIEHVLFINTLVVFSENQVFLLEEPRERPQWKRARGSCSAVRRNGGARRGWAGVWHSFGCSCSAISASVKKVSSCPVTRDSRHTANSRTHRTHVAHVLQNKMARSHIKHVHALGLACLLPLGIDIHLVLQAWARPDRAAGCCVARRHVHRDAGRDGLLAKWRRIYANEHVVAARLGCREYC